MLRQCGSPMGVTASSAANALRIGYNPAKRALASSYSSKCRLPGMGPTNTMLIAQCVGNAPAQWEAMLYATMHPSMRAGESCFRRCSSSRCPRSSYLAATRSDEPSDPRSRSLLLLWLCSPADAALPLLRAANTRARATIDRDRDQRPPLHLSSPTLRVDALQHRSTDAYAESGASTVGGDAQARPGGASLFQGGRRATLLGSAISSKLDFAATMLRREAYRRSMPLACGFIAQ